MPMLTTEQKINQGLEIKEEGNSLVKAGEYRKAAKKYRTIFLYINGLISKDNSEMSRFANSAELLTEEQLKKVKDLKMNAYTNLSLCYIKLNEPLKVIECATKAIDIDPGNVKALLRLGMAETSLQHWDIAKKHFLAGLKIEPDNTVIKSELLKWKNNFVKWEEEQKMKQKNAFGGKLLQSSE